MFEELLSHRAADGGGRLSFTAAAALHAAAAAAIVGASIWSVGETPEPAVPISWIVTAPPPPAGKENAGLPRPAATARARRAADEVPREIPATPEKEPENPVVAAPEGQAHPEGAGIRGEPGSGSAGIPGGIPGGTGTEMPIPGNLGGEIFQPGGDVRPPVLVFRTEPVYPEPARKARLEGEVILEAIITGSGDVEDVRVVKSAGPLLDPAAREAVGRWRYRPATLNGRAVRVALTVVVSFRLH